MKTLRFLNHAVTTYFTFWIIGFSILTYLYPKPFAGLTFLINTALGVIVFGMGITLKKEDFKACGITSPARSLHGGGEGETQHDAR